MKACDLEIIMIHQDPASWVGKLSNKSTPSPRGQSFWACISSRITTDIHVVGYDQINYNWYNELSAVSQYNRLYLDMHGLIF